ncbi:DUF2326 domain-containing protein [Neobacillus niacini]|uniref:DUF2326 domain-containing protein n=1 Tax=Neobacillus niacini TaxID=86668 RepID=UPI0005EE65E8|nr:DUF2326 domain-containing protein [Neobacillus niacini]
MVKLFINYVGTLPIKGKADVGLRKGLNVVFAEKILDGENSGPRNSLGKSTFVNLIDYGLGSNSFFQKRQVKARKELLNYYLIMEVSINECEFTLKRKLVDSTENLIYKGWIKNDLLKNNNIQPIVGPSLDDYKEFIELELLQKNNYINDEKLISLRSYIPFIIRNQVDGFSNIQRPMGISEGAQFARFRSEFFAGLSTLRKIELEQELLEAEEKRKQAAQDFNTIAKYLKKKESIANSENEYIDYESKIQQISNEISLLKQNLLERNNDEALLRNELKEIEQRLFILESEVSFNESRILNYQATINDIYKELDSFNLYTKASDFFREYDLEICPTCLRSFGDNAMPEEGFKEDSDSISLIQEILKNEISDLQNAIENMRVHIDELNTIKSELNDTKSRLIEKLSNFTASIITELNDKEHRLDNLKQEQAEILYLNGIQEDLEEYKSDLNIQVKKKKEINQKIDTANLEIEENKDKLIQVYDKVVRYLYNNTRQGILKFSPKANNIEVEIAYIDSEDNVDSGAAAQNVKVIAFDLALLELSINNSTYHPKLLIHDSPNVNDIDIDVYHNIFSYIIGLEEAELEKKGKVDFQYIITTISKPEEVLNEHIILQLDTGDEGGKLFGFTF